MFQFASWAEIQQVVPRSFFAAVAFVLGAIVGSFLNVCIHRMPRGDSIVTPRSRCYSCGSTVRWFDNIPLISYLLLRGKCRHCSAHFSIRYWLVELLTAILFLVLWLRFSPSLTVVYAIFIAGLIVATFIDFEHFIIPDEITLGGIIVGLICSGMFPSLQNEMLHWKGALWSLAGAAVGYGSLWSVVEIGKRIFGVKKLVLPEPGKVIVSSEGICVGPEIDRWEEIFSRESDVLSFEGKEICFGEKKWAQAKIQITWREIRVDSEIINLQECAELTATTQMIEIPREAMGFGDVKFLAAIGAFLGPKAIFFVILSSSLIGSVIGLLSMVLAKRGWGLKLPYGPYLALGAILWIFYGAQWTESYLLWNLR